MQKSLTRTLCRALALLLLLLAGCAADTSGSSKDHGFYGSVSGAFSHP